MLYLDKNDPLDAMALQELKGHPVFFDVWLDTMDQLAEEPDCEEILRGKGLRRGTVLCEAQAYREDFQSRLIARELPNEDRFELCRLFLSQAQSESSPELLRIYCEILGDPGFLLDHSTEWGNDDSSRDDEDQLILQYLDFLSERDHLLQALTLRRKLATKFADITKQNHSLKPLGCDTKRKYEIAQSFLKLFDGPQADGGEVLLGNLDYYIRVAASAPLKSIEPLFLFRLLTRRQRYMCSVPGLNVSLPALWKRDHNQIDRDNGRNFKQCRANLRLFTELCQIYEDDRLVDLPLCWYGLDQITVLGDFYRQQSQSVEEGTNQLPFPSEVGELVEDAMFSCFPNGAGDNVLLQDSGLTYGNLMEFQCSSHPLISHALKTISDYMNDHAAELTEQFLRADSEAVKSLCRDILEQSLIANSYQPKSTHDVGLFLAAINSGLMDLQDYYAEQNLIQAGLELCKIPIREIPISSG